MTLIADITHDISANPAPVLFLDTCVLLDVVRAPLRSKPDEVRFAQLFLSSVQKDPRTIHLLVPSPVQPEWDTHILERVNECKAAVNACNAVAAICSHLALPAVAALPADVLGMPALLHKLSTDLLAACVTIDNDGLALARAVDRIIASRHPVKQPHSKGAKDSVILEHAVERTAQLRNAGFAELCIFVSSNTVDFANGTEQEISANLERLASASRGAVDLDVSFQKCAKQNPFRSLSSSPGVPWLAGQVSRSRLG